jgi:hypothetical protein
MTLGDSRRIADFTEPTTVDLYDALFLHFAPVLASVPEEITRGIIRQLSQRVHHPLGDGHGKPLIRLSPLAAYHQSRTLVRSRHAASPIAMPLHCIKKINAHIFNLRSASQFFINRAVWSKSSICSGVKGVTSFSLIFPFNFGRGLNASNLLSTHHSKKAPRTLQWIFMEAESPERIPIPWCASAPAPGSESGQGALCHCACTMRPISRSDIRLSHC